MQKLETAAWRGVQPALDDYKRACDVARMHTPGGILLDVDREGIRKRVARNHSITPDDLKRWDDAQRARRPARHRWVL